jgi:hypothetical protein
VGRSPNTVRAYASDLKTFWAFLVVRGRDWREVDVEVLGEYMGWLRRPADDVVVLDAQASRGERRPSIGW